MSGRALSWSMERDLRAVALGLTRGDSEKSCEALCRRGLLRGDWITGYDLTPAGVIVVGQLDCRDEAAS